MAVGFPQDLNSLNSRAGNLAVGLRNTLRDIQTFKTELDRLTDGQLTSPPYNLDTGDVAVLRSAIADMADLAAAYTGEQSAHLTGTYDYRTFAGLLWGFA